MPLVQSIFAGGSVLAGALGDLLGRDDASGDMAAANAALLQEQLLRDQMVQDRKAQQLEAARLAGSMERRLRARMDVPPTLLGGDVLTDYTPRIRY